MVRLDKLFSKKPAAQAAPSRDTGPTHLPSDEAPASDRKALRLEQRELLYAVVRESMARVGMLSTSYKYKVLSLDSRGSQYLIMMDMPREMAEHIDQLAEIEEIVTQNARQRHKIDVTAVYWRINELARPATAVLRKPRPEPELSPPRETGIQAPPRAAEDRSRRFEPLRPDEVKAFKQGQTASGKNRPAPRPAPPEFAPTQSPPPDFEETRLDDGNNERIPLSRTQYGDLI